MKCIEASQLQVSTFTSDKKQEEVSVWVRLDAVIQGSPEAIKQLLIDGKADGIKIALEQSGYIPDQCAIDTANNLGVDLEEIGEIDFSFENAIILK